MVDILRFFHRNYLPEALSTMLSLVLMGIGITMFTNTERYFSSPTFKGVFDIMPPQAWGVAMVMAGAWLLMSVAFRDRLALVATSITACAVWTGWAVGITAATLGGSGVPSAAWVCCGMAAMASFTALLYAGEYIERIER